MFPTRPRRGAHLLRLAATVAVVTLSAGLGSPGTAQAALPYEGLEGTGSSWSANALAQWARDVQPAGIQVVYSPSGSGAGRNDFRSGVNDFGVSEIPYGDRNSDGSIDVPPADRPFAYLPFVAGGTSLTYQLQVGGQRVTNLRLSSGTVARIFTNQITNWNDPAISADNNGRVLPSLTIRPVVRADNSGTTAQMTDYLNSTNRDIWAPFNGGQASRTSVFPAQRPMVSVTGSDGVMNTITASSGNGTIGYVEYSYATNARYPVAKLLNAGGFFTEPTDRNVAVALQAAKINPADLTQDLSGVYTYNDPRTYPMSSYSYLIIPTSGNDQKLNANKAQTLADYISYSICEGQASAGRLGYSPLPLNLAQAGFEQVRKLQTAFPAIDLVGRDVTKCNNPTFFPGAPLDRNRLAEEAPQPAACDAVGQGPCVTGTGGAEGNPNPPGDSGNAAPDNPAGTAPGGGGAGGGGAGGGGAGGGGDTGGGGAAPGAGGGGGAVPGATGAGATVGADGSGTPGAVAGADLNGDGVPDPVAVDPETGLAVASGAGGAGGGGALYGTPTELAANRSTGMAPTLGALAAVELLLLLLVPALVARSLTRRRLRNQA